MPIEVDYPQLVLGCQANSKEGDLDATDPSVGPSFVANLGIREGVKALLARTAREFEKTGDWVTSDTLAYEAAEQNGPLDPNEAFKIPSILGRVWSEEKVSLTGLGLLIAGTAERTAEMMANLAEICGVRKLEPRDKAKIGRNMLASEYGFSEENAQRALQLVQRIPRLSGSGTLGGEWSLDIERAALQ